MKENVKFNVLLLRMQRLCSSREYCTYDIEQKLVKEELSADEILRLIATLTKEKFIDDLRYARAFANDKIKFAGWGPDKIVYTLKSKKISNEIINDVKESFDRDISKLQLKKILEQKLRGISKGEEREKLLAKLVRFGVSRGFGYGDVYEVSKQIIKFNE